MSYFIELNLKIKVIIATSSFKYISFKVAAVTGLYFTCFNIAGSDWLAVLITNTKMRLNCYSFHHTGSFQLIPFILFFT